MRYEITKSRPDGYYRYTKYDDNDSSVFKMYYNNAGELTKIKFNVGWSLYSKQKTEEEKTAWLAAVQKYNDDHQVTGVTATLHSYIQDVRDFISLDDKNFPPNQSLMMPSIASLASIVEPEGKCDDEFLKKIHEMGLGPLPTPTEMFRHAYKAGRFNVKNEISKQLYSYAQLGLNSFVTPVLDTADGMIDTVFGTIDLVYTEIVRLCNKAYRLYKQIVNIVNNPEERKRLFNLFLEEIKKYGKDIYEFLYQALCVDVFIEIFKTMRNMWNTRKDIWKSLVAKLKALIDFDYKSLGSEIINNLAGAIIGFLPLLGALIGALFAKKCGDEAGVEASRQNSARHLSDGKTTNPDDRDKIVRDKVKNSRAKLKAASVVYTLCLEEQNNFSFAKKFKLEDNVSNEKTDSSLNEIDNVSQIHCKVSMCDYEDPTDLDYFTNEAAMFSELVTIEFDKSFVYSFNVSVGQIVRIYDVIGYISGIPVKSQFDFKVNEIYDNYIIGEYYYGDIDPNDKDITQTVVAYVNSRINTQDTADYEKLQSNFTDIAACEDFILNYGPYCRLPDYALNTGSYLLSKTIGTYIDDYYEYLDDEKNRQADELKRVAGKDNAYARGMAGQMYTLKEEIDNAKAKMLDRFISLSTSSKGGARMKCKSRIADYSLYSYYLDYLYSDRFIYNDDNKFIVKLHNLISEFIAERTKIELSNENISALIVDFNDTCDKYIKPYWKFNNQSYYQTFAKLFTSDYYEMNTEKIVPKNDEKDSFTLYNRIYMYLTSLTSFTPKGEQNKISIDENTDVSKMINNLSKMSNDSAINKDDEKVKTNLRRIALKFITLRKVEQNMQNGFVNSFIKENDIALEKLSASGINPIPITEYYEGEVLMMGLVPLIRSTYLGSYLTMLKKTTEAESKKLHALINEAVSWYKSHRNDNENIIELFKPLMQINWPVLSVIYKDNKKSDFYLFSPVMGVTPPLTTMKELKELEKKNEKDANTNSYPECIGAHPLTADGCGLTRIQYWLRYCGVATAIHCMMPMYWSTGIIIPPIPYIMLPVIYIPFYVLKGRVTIVFGLGLCGIMPLPMILFVNMGTLPGSIIAPINMVVDMMLNMTKKMANMETKSIEAMLNPMIKTLDSQIREMEIEKEDIPYQIQQIKSLHIKGKSKVLDAVNALQANDMTFKAEMKAEDTPIIPVSPTEGDVDYDSYVLDEEAMARDLAQIKWDTYERREDSFTKAYREQMANASKGGSGEGSDDYDEDYDYAYGNYDSEGSYSSDAEFTQLEYNRTQATGATYIKSSTSSKELYARAEGANAAIMRAFFPDLTFTLAPGTGYVKLPPASEISKHIVNIQVETLNGKKNLQIHEKIAGEVQQMFEKIKAAGFNVYMVGGFCYRAAKNPNGTDQTMTIGGKTVGKASNHSLGLAFDINWDVNGYHKVKGVLGRDVIIDPSLYNHNTQVRSNNDTTVRIILNAPAAGIGKWGWGGNYTNSKDWMHFSALNGW